MLRCVLLAAVFAAFVQPAAAQAPRNFPGTALRGELVVTQPPEALLNKRPARLAPGARIRGQNNMLVMSGAMVGTPVFVHYTLDPTGNLLDVWILTPAELAKKPWPATRAEAAAWRFNPDTQVWIRP